MAITIDWSNKLVLSTASITDIIAFKDTIRDFEDDDVGMLYPPVITFKQLSLGGGAFFYGVDFINGYQLKFPDPGNYNVIGNIGATIVPVAGVYVDRTKAAAFAAVSGEGGSSVSAVEIADAVRLALSTELARIDASISSRYDGITELSVNVAKMNGEPVIGKGKPLDKWRG